MKPSIKSVFSVSFWLRSLFSDASKIWLLPHLLRQTSAVWESEPRALSCVRRMERLFFGRFRWQKLGVLLPISTSLEDWKILIETIDWVKLTQEAFLHLFELWLSLDVEFHLEGHSTRTWVDIGHQTHSTTTFFSGMPMAEQTSFTHLSSWLSISQSLIMLPSSISARSTNPFANPQLQ